MVFQVAPEKWTLTTGLPLESVMSIRDHKGPVGRLDKWV